MHSCCSGTSKNQTLLLRRHGRGVVSPTHIGSTHAYWCDPRKNQNAAKNLYKNFYLLFHFIILILKNLLDKKVIGVLLHGIQPKYKLIIIRHHYILWVFLGIHTIPIIIWMIIRFVVRIVIKMAFFEHIFKINLFRHLQQYSAVLLGCLSGLPGLYFQFYFKVRTKMRPNGK